MFLIGGILKHYVMPIMRKMNLINVNFWTYLRFFNLVPGAAMLLANSSYLTGSRRVFSDMLLSGKTNEIEKRKRKRIFAQTQKVGFYQSPLSVMLAKRIATMMLRII